jgi:hypothetical protein
MDNLRYAAELRTSLAGWSAVLGDMLEGGSFDDDLRWLLGRLAARLEEVAEAMRDDGLAALAEQADRRRRQVANPEMWCAGVAWDEEDKRLSAVTRVAQDLAGRLAKDGEQWAQVYEALHHQEVLNWARGQQPVES